MEGQTVIRGANLIARKAAKPKLSKCRICKSPFEKRSMGHVACRPDCAQEVAKRKSLKDARIAAKIERQSDKARKEALEPLEYFLKKAERAFNSYIVRRDAHLACISCGRTNADAWNAGHYISVGANRTIRFHEDNVNKQCARPCNKDLGGNAIKYRIGLIAKIGVERVEALESWHAPKKMTIAEAKEITALYRQKLKAVLQANEGVA